MPTIGATTLKSRSTTVAVIRQSVRGTFVDPAANLIAVSNVSLNINTVETENPEYTGTIEGNAADVALGAVELTFSVNLRGPGGADVPAADAFLTGILLVASKMTEVRVLAAVPASPEALTAGAVAGFTGGAGMSASVNAYRGMVVDLAAAGAKPKSFAGVRSNTAAKVVGLARKYAAPLTGNYQFPKQLVYTSNLSQTDPLPLSMKVWISGRRYDLIDLAISSLTIEVPTTTRDQGAIPLINVTVRGRLFADADQATPALPALGATPQFRDGQQFLANEYVAGSGFTLESGAQAESPPDPNVSDGSGAEELVGLSRSLQVRMQGYTKADFDSIALANAQTQHAFWAQWGKTSGQTICVVLADARFGFSALDLGSNIVTENPRLYIDALDKNVSIIFPYW